MSAPFDFPGWLPVEVKEIAVAFFSKDFEPSQTNQFREKLITDPRMKEVWEKFCAIADFDVKRAYIKRFLEYAPIFLADGQNLQITDKKKRALEGLKSCEKSLRQFSKTIKYLPERPSEIIAQLDQALPELVAWLTKEIKNIEIHSYDITSLLYGEKFAPLEKLKYRGQKKFDEMRTFILLGQEFIEFFGQPYDALNGITVMVMKAIPEDPYAREALRSRVNKARKLIKLT